MTQLRHRPCGGVSPAFLAAVHHVAGQRADPANRRVGRGAGAIIGQRGGGTGGADDGKDEKRRKQFQVSILSGWRARYAAAHTANQLQSAQVAYSWAEHRDRALFMPRIIQAQFDNCRVPRRNFRDPAACVGVLPTFHP